MGEWGKGEKGERTTSAAAVTDTNALSAHPPFPPSPPPRKRKGPRPKHVPRRMCVACREHDTKRALYRIVRTPEGAVAPDPTRRRNGRGAYLCGREACWQKALASGLLARALNVDIDTETKESLRRYAATLALEGGTP